MSEVAKKLASVEEAEGAIRELMRECVEGGADREDEALAVAGEWGIAPGWVREGFATARRGLAEAKEVERELAREEARIEAREAEEAKREAQPGPSFFTTRHNSRSSSSQRYNLPTG